MKHCILFAMLSLWTVLCILSLHHISIWTSRVSRALWWHVSGGHHIGQEICETFREKCSRKVLAYKHFMFECFFFICYGGSEVLPAEKGPEGPFDFSTIQSSLRKQIKRLSSCRDCWWLMAHSCVFLWALSPAKGSCLAKGRPHIQ